MYYVIYERYDEYNQFEGRWLKDWDIFDSLKAARDFMDELESNDYRGAELLMLWRCH